MYSLLTLCSSGSSCYKCRPWWNYITLLEHFLNGTDRLRFAPAERWGAAEGGVWEIPRALAGGQNSFAANSYNDCGLGISLLLK